MELILYTFLIFCYFKQIGELRSNLSLVFILMPLAINKIIRENAPDYTKGEIFGFEPFREVIKEVVNNSRPNELAA